ncbi:MAG: hypothetical protein IIA14_06760 [SAR324 cluster bacterium]|nr:hypothetical protein [SAR324 cluster bacterium]
MIRVRGNRIVFGLLLMAGVCGGGSDWASADAVGGELIVLTTHVQSQRDAPLHLYDRKLDAEGRYVLTPGLEIYFDRELEEPIWKATEVRFSAGLLSDSIKHQFGYLAFMGRWVFSGSERFEWSLHAGPGLIFRESWRSVPGYLGDNPLRESEDFLPGYEYLFLILAEIDLLYRFSPDLQGVWSIVPGIPFVIVQSLGLRWSY